MDSPLAIATRIILNDRNVFSFLHDQDSRANVQLFGSDEWASFREAFSDKDFDSVKRQAESCKARLNTEQEQWRKRQKGSYPGQNPYWPNIKLVEAFLTAPQRCPSTLKYLFDMFDDFGALNARFRNMEDFGKVAEFEPTSELRRFFLYKIDKADSWEKVPLKHIFEQVEYLLDQQVDSIHIGFFLRKLESLKLLPEVIING